MSKVLSARVFKEIEAAILAGQNQAPRAPRGDGPDLPFRGSRTVIRDALKKLASRRTCPHHALSGGGRRRPDRRGDRGSLFLSGGH